MRQRIFAIQSRFLSATLSAMLISLASFAALSVSCTTAEKKLAETVQVSLPHQVMLWEASKGEQRAFILGTFHVGIRPSELDRVVWERLKESKLVVLEMDITSVSQAEALPYMFLPPGQSLRQILGPEAWTNLTDRIAGQISDENLDRLSLTAVFQILISQLAPHGESIDLSILEAARDQNKSTAFLETFAFQAQLLQKYIEADMVSDLLTKDEQAKAFFQEMVRVYLAGDPDELDRIMHDPTSDFAMTSEQYRTMVISRNQRWIKILAEMFQQGPTFVAVGAGHLPGQDGLLRLLQDQGYQLQRLGSP